VDNNFRGGCVDTPWRVPTVISPSKGGLCRAVYNDSKNKNDYICR